MRLHRGQSQKLHRARWRKLGATAEARICMVCGACRVNSEEFHKSQLIALCSSMLGEPSPIFNEEEMAILRNFAPPTLPVVK